MNDLNTQGFKPLLSSSLWLSQNNLLEFQLLLHLFSSPPPLTCQESDAKPPLHCPKHPTGGFYQGFRVDVVFFSPSSHLGTMFQTVWLEITGRTAARPTVKFSKIKARASGVGFQN